MKKLTADQLAKKAERQAKQKELFARLAKMNAVERAVMASQMPVVNVEGRMLSACNMCLLAFQRADVTVVGGFRQWLGKGRCVRKGERGLTIRVPCGRKSSNDAESTETGEAGESVYFVGGTVFDVSQTDELPAHSESRSDVNDPDTDFGPTYPASCVAAMESEAHA